MSRLLLCTFALAGGFALSCQIFPAGTSGPTAPLAATALPPVSAAPLVAPLADTIAQVEGTLSPREREVRRVLEILEGRHTGLSRREIRSVAETVVDEAAAHDLEVGMVMAVIQVESAGYHRAVSPVGALGLMQLMPNTGREMAERLDIEWFGRETLFDPVVNVKLGVAYLRELADRYDHVPTALAAYNWGPGRIDRRLRRGAKMPQLYVEQVMRAYDSVETSDAPGGSS